MQIDHAETHYNYFRDYDPAIGRYVQSDPIGLRGGSATYSYVGAMPVGRSDPLGLLHLNGAERVACLANPIGCAFASLCIQRAFDYAGKSANDAGDARRHCYLSCCMAKMVGPVLAKRLGDAHEYGDENNRECERAMDLYNNMQGLSAAMLYGAEDCGTSCRRMPLQNQPEGSCAPCKRKFFGIFGGL